MLPLADTIRSRSFPIVNWLIIAANAFVFVHTLQLPQGELERFIETYALIPAHLNPANPSSYLTLITHQFLHGGWLHFLSNMWVLFIFGDNIEDRLGSMRYLIFYLLGGIAAGLLQVYFTTDPTQPALGASGAIAAVLGAYLVFYPLARVLTLIPIFIIPFFVRIPAIIFIGIWFAIQLFSGLSSLGASAQTTNVAWWAHVGGFLFGLLLARPICSRRCAPKWHEDEYYPF